jgi:hypothetical protein
LSSRYARVAINFPGTKNKNTGGFSHQTPWSCLLPLADIVADREFHPRVDGIDPQHVRELELFHEHWPRLKVVWRGGQYLLVDGFHTYAAAQKLGTVAVAVLEASDTEDLHTLAFMLNAAHGAPLTLNDWRAFAARLLRSHPDWSDREIPVTTTRVGRDGRPCASPLHRHGKITVAEFLEQVASTPNRNEHRRIVRYLEKLANFLEDQDALKGFQTIQDAAKACWEVLAAEDAKELAERLGWSSGNIFDIARALGYRAELRS